MWAFLISWTFGTGGILNNMADTEDLRITFTSLGEDVHGTFIQVAMSWKDPHGQATGRNGERLRLGEDLRFTFTSPKPSIRFAKKGFRTEDS